MFDDEIILKLRKIKDLRYGENWHQKAAFYSFCNDLYDEKNITSLVNSEQIHGKELSLTNILDLDSALGVVKQFDEPVVVVIKHTNPCGAACADNITEAFEKAWAGDSLSAFGSVVGFNRKVDEKTAEKMSKRFIECVIAPDFDEDALKILKKKKNIRLIKTGPVGKENPKIDIKKVSGGFIVQEYDNRSLEKKDLKVVTKKNPSEKELESLLFAWKILRFVKSNAIVLAKNKQVIGVGAGQMSRIDALKSALRKAKEMGFDIKNAVLASDSFFPFRDAVDMASENGITSIMQPGGSIRDQESIDACNEHGISMIFNGVRCFRH